MEMNRITVKKDGVYISSRESEHGAFQSHKDERLTKIYREGGQKALDQKIFELSYTLLVELKGDHPSIRRYKDTFRCPEGKEIFAEYKSMWESSYNCLTEENKCSCWKESRTPGATAFLAKMYEYEQRVFKQLAEICPPVKDRVQKEKCR